MQVQDDVNSNLSFYSLEKSHTYVKRFFTIIVFITAIIGASSDTYIYYANQFQFLVIINIILIVLLLIDLFLLLFKKLTLRVAFMLLLYITLINISVTHIHEIRYDNFLAKSIMIGLWGVLFIALSGIVLGDWHPYLVMIWADALLVFDLIRTGSDFLLELIPIIMITYVGLSFGFGMYMKLLRKSIRKNKEAFVEITEQKELIENQTEEMKVINNNLHELQSSQKDLIEMLVHDMKNPLNNILNSTQSSPSNSANNSMHEAGRQILLLVENMLNVHRMETTHLPLNLQAIHLSKAIHEALKQTRYMINLRNVSVDLNLTDSIYILADGEILIRILVNLLTNAIKHSPENSCIKIVVKNQHSGMAVISIKDQGGGIPQKFQANVFEKFEQALPHASGSTGLGLAFCKMSVELMSGKIWIAESSTQGTAISFSLPIDHLVQSKKKHACKLSLEQFEFSSDDKLVLAPAITKLKNLEIYKAGQIVQELSVIPVSNTKIEQWIEEVENSVYAVNPLRFKQLIDLSKMSNQ